MSEASNTNQRVTIGQSADVPEGGRLVVDIGDRTIGVFRVAGRLYAYDNVCAHQGGPVCQGLIIPRVREVLDDRLVTTGRAFDAHEMHIVCPWHGFEYNITTGCHVSSPAIRLTSVVVYEKGRRRSC